MTFVTLIAFTSCDDQLGSTKLDLKTIENEEILVENYNISEITTIHQFVDITNKRWSKKERILEANSGSVDSVYIRHDTLYLRKTSSQPTIYDLASIKFGYNVVLIEPNSD